MKKSLIVLVIIVLLATVMYIISGYSSTQTVACTQEALICPDGSSVGRTGPKCKFSPCPIPVSQPEESKNKEYQCPESEYVDCMPGPDKTKPECNSEFLQWAKDNCPNFKGAAY